MKDQFTPRNAAKFVLSAIVKAKAAQKTEDIITDYTRFEEDDMIVDISSSLIGWWVGEKLKPVTDAIVDRSADFITDQRAKRAAKKEAAEEQ